MRWGRGGWWECMGAAQTRAKWLKVGGDACSAASLGRLTVRGRLALEEARPLP